MTQRIKSVIELSKYKAGDTAYWVTLRPIGLDQIIIPEGEEWLIEHHPKTLYERGYAKKAWKSRKKLPKLHHVDFSAIVAIVTSKLVVEPFEVHDIFRSNGTGEFFYSNEEDEWMPESYLLDSTQAARRERERILKMCKNWAEGD
jgi:hypothetical protein